MIRLPTYRYCSNNKIELIANMNVFHLHAAWTHDSSVAFNIWFNVAIEMCLFDIKEFCNLIPAQFFLDYGMIRAMDIQMEHLPEYKNSKNMWYEFYHRVNIEHTLVHCYCYETILTAVALPDISRPKLIQRLYNNEGEYVL